MRPCVHVAPNVDPTKGYLIEEPSRGGVSREPDRPAALKKATGALAQPIARKRAPTSKQVKRMFKLPKIGQSRPRTIDGGFVVKMVQSINHAQTAPQPESFARLSRQRRKTLHWGKITISNQAMCGIAQRSSVLNHYQKLTKASRIIA